MKRRTRPARPLNNQNGSLMTSSQTGPARAPVVAHESKQAMADRLAGEIAAGLEAAIHARGRASFVVSGGSTPRPLYERLSVAPLDWSKVDVVLMDERWVSPAEDGSNEALVRDTLLQNAGAAARFYGLWSDAPDMAAGRDAAEARMAAVPAPFDIALFGIGTDGHTASWFPRGEGLDAALSETGRRIEAVTARASEVTGDLTTRMTLTFSAFIGARLNLLIMAGDAKRAAWDAAHQPGAVEDAPVRRLLRDDRFDLIAHWTPQ